MNETASIAFSLNGVELALVPPALNVYLHVPFGLTGKTPMTPSDYERLQMLCSSHTDMVVEIFMGINANATGATRAGVIALRKRAVLALEMPREDLVLICRALREVSVEYANEPKGINTTAGGSSGTGHGYWPSATGSRKRSS